MRLFQNVNTSYRMDQVAFLRYLASEDRGNMSRFLRSLLDNNEEFRAWEEYQARHNPRRHEALQPP